MPGSFSAPGNVFSVLPGPLGLFCAPGSQIFKLLKVLGTEVECWEDGRACTTSEKQGHYERKRPKTCITSGGSGRCARYNDTSISISPRILLPGKRGRREPPELPASRANRRAGLCAAVVHHHIPPSKDYTPKSLAAGNSRAAYRAAVIRTHRKFFPLLLAANGVRHKTLTLNNNRKTEYSKRALRFHVFTDIQFVNHHAPGVPSRAHRRARVCVAVRERNGWRPRNETREGPES